MANFSRSTDRNSSRCALDITLPYKTAQGMASRTVTAWVTHYGPVVRAQDGKWVSVRMMADTMHALEQSHGRTKARNYAEFLKVMALRTNSSNNTVYEVKETITVFNPKSGYISTRRDVCARPIQGCAVL